ncbi:MAG: ABC transporter substrate-binding protein [Cyclobacteriaceae bacterium]
MKLASLFLPFFIYLSVITDLGAQKLDSVSLHLGYQFQFQFAGYIAAYEKGYYRDEGLEVEFYTGIGAPFIDIDSLAAYDYFIGTGSQLLGLNRRNELLLVAAIFQHSPLSLVARRDLGINYLIDLEGRNIGTGAENMAMLLSAGLNIDSINNSGPTSLKHLLETGELHAVSRYLLDPPLDPDKYITFKPLEYGVDFYGECLVTYQSELEINPDRVEKMYKATIKGWQYAVSHPEELIDLIRSKYNKEKTQADLEREADVVINSLILPNLFPIGYSTKAKWVNMEKVSRQFGVIEGETDWDKFLYSEIRNQRATANEELLQIIKIAISAIMVVIVFLIMYSVMLKRAVNKRTLQLLVANTDIQNKNERLAMQTQELEELNAFKNKMLAVISHDVKGPLANMDSLMQLVKNSDLSEEEFKEMVNDLHGRLREVSGFLLNILMWAKSQIYGFSSAPERIYPKELIDETVSVFQSEIDKKQLNIVNSIEADIELYADASLVKLIVRNLLTNAIKFSYEATDILITSARHGDFIRFTIADKGVGISEERKTQLLKGAVQSLKTESGELGSGLGLMLCKEFVDMHKGEMGIKSEVGKGTSVWFTLPMTSPTLKV